MYEEIYFKEFAQVQNLQNGLAGWRPKEKLMLQFKSKGCWPKKKSMLHLKSRGHQAGDPGRSWADVAVEVWMQSAGRIPSYLGEVSLSFYSDLQLIG